jgi:NADPH:quinone reductase-like Zn-dependent oxidoreductase
MKANLIRKYGGPEVLEFADVDSPKPAPGEVLVRVAAAGVNPLDWKLRSGAMKMIMPLKFPAILGCDFAGTVDAVGERCTKLKVGDEVYGMMSTNVGTYAQFLVASESIVARKAKNLSFEQAASVPVAAITALQALRDSAHVKAGDRVLINGASGGVGLFGVQLAKIFGAEVTAVCSAGNADLVKALGADHVIDYKTTDFTKGDVQYHTIADFVGNGKFTTAKRVLLAGGTFVSSLPNGGLLFLSAWTSVFGSRKAKAVFAKPSVPNFEYLNELFEAGKLKAIIDRTFGFEQAREALDYSETGRAKGKIVIKIAG